MTAHPGTGDTRGGVAPRWLRELPLAHRGLHGPGGPENSLPALAAARDAGYGVELDVQLTRDEVPVVLHDPTLVRMTGVDQRVAQRTAAELAEVRLAGSDEPIPTLADALDVLGDTPTMVEVKSLRLGSGRIEPAVAGVLDRHGGPWCVAGFNPATLRWFRRHRPHVPRVLTAAAPRGYGPLPRVVARRLAALADLDATAPAAVSYALDGLPVDAVTRWRADGGAVVTWTVRTDAELARARELADNVVFEHLRP